MKYITSTFLIGSFVFSQFSWAGSFSDQCPEIVACAKSVGDLLGQKYVFDADVKGKIKSTPNLVLNKDNAELLFTHALNMNGYSRVPLGIENSYQIMKIRDARDAAIPAVTAEKDSAPTLPQSWDLYILKYKAKFPEGVEDLARMSRTFLPANARIVPVEASGMLLVTDSAVNLKKIYQILSENDVKPKPKLKNNKKTDDL